MSVETIDRALAEWDERLRRIDESLLALEAEPTYQMLAPGASARARLEGESARVVAPALAALGELFEHRVRLTEVLDRARQVRASMSGLAFWTSDDKEREIVQLLEGPSIELPPEATPLARRALLDRGARDVLVEPEQLLSAMMAAYDRARDAVVAVQRAWDHVEAQLGGLEQQIAGARAEAAALGVEAAVGADLDALAGEVDGARTRVAVDPLGATGDVAARLSPRVADLTGRIAGLSVQRQRALSALGHARATLDTARQAHADAHRAAAALPAEIEGAQAPAAPSEPAFVEGLGPWLERIAEAAAGGRWATAEVGLARWQDAVRPALASDTKIAGALAAVLARREELAGRLSARRAQAAARGATVDPASEELAREAERLLARRPTPLARASELVERYEVAARGRGR